MDFYFSEKFIHSFKKLLKTTANKNLEELFISLVFKKKKNEIIFHGTSNINNSDTNQLLKKRIKKKNSGSSSGYRAYFYFIVKKESFEFMYIYPKTGRRSQSTVKKQQLTELITEHKTCKEQGNMIQVRLNKDENKIIDCKTKKEIF